ncbi:MAG: hypothetical protein ACI87X_001348 [Candidatus Arcticimaribacter sp.]
MTSPQKNLLKTVEAPKQLLKKKSNLLKIKGIGNFHLKGIDIHESYFPAVNQGEIFIKKEGITPLIYPSAFGGETG